MDKDPCTKPYLLLINIQKKKTLIGVFVRSLAIDSSHCMLWVQNLQKSWKIERLCLGVLGYNIIVLVVVGKIRVDYAKFAYYMCCKWLNSKHIIIQTYHKSFLQSINQHQLVVSFRQM